MASRNSGCAVTSRRSSSMSRQRTRAPRRTPPSPTAMLPSPGTLRRSTSMLGVASRKASTGIRLCPPAITVASGSDASRSIASRSVAGAWYSKGAGFIPCLASQDQESQLVRRLCRRPDGGTRVAMSQLVRALSWSGSFVLQHHVCRLFANHDRWRVGVARGECRHDRSVCDPQPFDAMDAKLRVDDRHCIGAHLAGPDRVVSRFRRLFDPVQYFVVGGPVYAGGDLGYLKRSHRGCGHDRASDADGAHGQFRIGWAYKVTPDWREILGPLGPGSVSIGIKPSIRSGASRPSREQTKARIGAPTMASIPFRKTA